MIRLARPGDEAALGKILEETGLAIAGHRYDQWTSPILVAEHDGQIVGFLQGLVGQPYTVLMDMAVLPEHQHRGIGRELLAAMEGLLREMGVTSWLTVIGDTRPGVQSALEQWGAKPTGTGVAYIRHLKED